MSRVEIVGGVPFRRGGGVGRGRIDENWLFGGVSASSFTSCLAVELNPEAVEDRRTQGRLLRERALAERKTELICGRDEKWRVAQEAVLKANCMVLLQMTILYRSEVYLRGPHTLLYDITCTT